MRTKRALLKFREGEKYTANSIGESIRTLRELVDGGHLESKQKSGPMHLPSESIEFWLPEKEK
jgi:hypothetical protein